MFGSPNRIQPALPSGAYTTYGFVMPKQTHQRKISCKEFDCQAYKYGWMKLVDLDTDLGRKQAQYIRDHSGKHYSVSATGNIVTFTFAAEQECFDQHYVNLEKNPIFTKRLGDWRSSNCAEVIEGERWLEDFRENQINLKEELENQ